MIRLCVYASALALIAFPSLATANTCKALTKQLTAALQSKLVADLEVETIRFRQESILKWRETYGSKKLLREQYELTKTDLSSAEPLAVQADNDYEEALLRKTETCPDDD